MDFLKIVALSFLFVRFSVSLEPLCPAASTSKRCMISCRGDDGLGHQIEAKLTCVAVAHMLGLEYIHMPFSARTEHINYAEEMEKLFNLGYCYRKYDDTKMENTMRLPLPDIGHCYQRGGWLEKASQSKSAVCAPEDDPKIVYIADNCWDVFWCPHQDDKLYKAWYEVLPRLQRVFTSLSRNNTKFDPAVVNIAVHIRGGDAKNRIIGLSSRVTPLTYYINIMKVLRSKFQALDRKIMFWVHTDEIEEAENIKNTLAHEQFSMEFYTGSTSLYFAMNQMLHSDILVVAKSSLSYSMAMIGNMTAIVPDCYDRVPLPHWVAAPCDGVADFSDLALNQN